MYVWCQRLSQTLCSPQKCTDQFPGSLRVHINMVLKAMPDVLSAVPGVLGFAYLFATAVNANSERNSARFTQHCIDSTGKMLGDVGAQVDRVGAQLKELGVLVDQLVQQTSCVSCRFGDLDRRVHVHCKPLEAS